MVFHAPLSAQTSVKMMKPASDSIARYLSLRATVAGEVGIDTFYINKSQRKLDIHFSDDISAYPLRASDI